jgi:hypothetical protein
MLRIGFAVSALGFALSAVAIFFRRDVGAFAAHMPARRQERKRKSPVTGAFPRLRD